MKSLQLYDKLNLNDTEAAFSNIINTLKPSSTLWTYFVNWEKVFENTKNIEISLNILNYLVGKEDFDKEFRYIVKTHPEVIPVLPALLVRDGSSRKKFSILVDYSGKRLVYEEFNFSSSNHSDSDIENYLLFVKNSGLIRLFKEDKVKNLVDYMIGVEAGLDSNGRKNRGGTAMESIVEAFVKTLCLENGYKYLVQADAAKIKREFNYEVPVDKSSRRYDFVIKTDSKVVIIEVNFYSGGGSKLKATAGEYKVLQNVLRESVTTFIWITDGLGWLTAKRPLSETFENNDYIFNLELLEKGALHEILNLR